jgi:hypothetical protein
MNKTIYRYTDDSWVDGDPNCPCCSGLSFEAYNAEGWSHNGSATDLWGLYVDVLVAHKAREFEEDYMEMGYWAYCLYEGLTLEELASLCERLGIVLEEV